MKWFYFSMAAFLACSGCRETKLTQSEELAIWNKIKIDFTRLDANGLTGPDDGKVSVHYEFCIPANEKYWVEVKKIDETAVKNNRGKGRAGCTRSQWLVIGDTRQPNYMRTLYELARLPYVERIEETFWE